jgi:hypothetical protein
MKSKEESKYLRFLVNFWTVLTFFTIILNVIEVNRLTDALGPVLAIYTGALAIYGAEKEFERWKFYFVGRHPGEVYVAVWTALLFGIFVWTFVSGSKYKMEPEIIATYIVVLGVLVITKKSKVYFKELCEPKSPVS